MINGRVTLPEPGQLSTHILKPPIAHLPSTTENEALAHRLAAAIGLPTAAVEPRRTGGRPYLIVERYDRTVDTAGVIRRLHQEDFCQALGVASENKYASEWTSKAKPATRHRPMWKRSARVMAFQSLRSVSSSKP